MSGVMTGGPGAESKNLQYYQKEETKWIFPHAAPLALKFEQIPQSWRSTCTCIYFISEGEPTCLYMLCMQ